MVRPYRRGTRNQTQWNRLRDVLPFQPQRQGPLRHAARHGARRPLFLEQLEQRLVLVSTLSVGNAVFNLAAGPAGFQVTRSGDLTPVVDVGYAVTDGTAISGTNYTSSAPRGPCSSPRVRPRPRFR